MQGLLSESVGGTAIYAIPTGNLATPAWLLTTGRISLFKDFISYITGCNLGYRKIPSLISNDAILSISGITYGYGLCP